MELSKAISTRRSIHKYLDIPVEMEKVGRMLSAAIMAPSAGNLQPWKFILVTEEEKRKAIANTCFQQHWISRAPLIIVAVAEPQKPKRLYGERGEKLYSLLDTAAATQNLILTATAEGLATCWVSAFEESILKRELSIPDHAKPIAVIPTGYADENPVTPIRFPLFSIAYVEKWGSRNADPAAYFGYTSNKVQDLIKKGKLLIEKIVEKARKVD